MEIEDWEAIERNAEFLKKMRTFIFLISQESIISN